MIYITSDMEYVGCTINSHDRRMQHIHNLMRHYLDIERSHLPIYAKTRAQGKLAMAKLCVLVPFEISSPQCKFNDEARSIRILCPSKNVRLGMFHIGNLRSKCLGSRERIRRRGGGRYIPSIPKSMRVDKTLFSMMVHEEGSHEAKELVSTRIEDMAKVWYQQAVFLVTPGRFDNSGWVTIFRAFKNSVFLRMDTNQEMNVYELSKLCSVSPTNNAVNTILVKIVAFW